MTTSEHDEPLLGAISRALAATSPMPDYLLEAAKAAIFWRTIDAELAELVFDSATEELTSVRSATIERQLTFRSFGLEIEIMLDSSDGQTLMGQLVPAERAEVDLRFGTHVITAETDEWGQFTFVGLPAGSVQLVVRRGTRILAVTDWFVL
jgi:hypothetical protein